MASMAQVAEVEVSDTAVHKRFNFACAQVLRQVLEEMTAVVIEAAEPVPVPLLPRFGAVILQDRSVITLPSVLAEIWPGCGNQAVEEAASLKRHVRS